MTSRNTAIRERWVSYLLTMECRVCDDQIFPHREEAEAEIDHILDIEDFGADPTIEQLRGALTWTWSKGKFCHYCAEQLG
jgi:hypothetical protein